MQHSGVAFLRMELNVENPVFAGDTVHTECEVIEVRRSRSRRDRGLARPHPRRQTGQHHRADLYAIAHDHMPEWQYYGLICYTTVAAKILA